MIDTTPQVSQNLDDGAVATSSSVSQSWKGLKLQIRQGLEGAGRFYQQLVFKVCEAVGVADGEPIWNDYLGQWQVAVNFANGCKSVVCDWLMAVN